MSYRGTVKNGIVVLEGGIQLPEGQPVVVVVTVPETPAETVDLPAFGIWSDREEMADAAEASLKLRRDIEGRRQ